MCSTYLDDEKTSTTHTNNGALGVLLGPQIKRKHRRPRVKTEPKSKAEQRGWMETGLGSGQASSFSIKMTLLCLSNIKEAAPTPGKATSLRHAEQCLDITVSSQYERSQAQQSQEKGREMNVEVGCEVADCKMFS